MSAESHAAVQRDDDALVFDVAFPADMFAPPRSLYVIQETRSNSHAPKKLSP
jgi:hypothetical protein